MRLAGCVFIFRRVDFMQTPLSSSSPSTSTRRSFHLTHQRYGIIAIIALVIFHEVGVVGLHLAETRELFLQVVPFNLLLSVVVLLLFHQTWTMRFGILCFSIFWVGYLVEVLGVSTGVIFGPYHYDTALGFKIAGVPPVIGLNWLMLVYTTGIMAQSLSQNIWVRTTIAALAMVLLDVLIEPMAVRFDFWTWETDLGYIPVQNFLAWFVISWGMAYAFQAHPGTKTNPVAIPLYIIQFFFFLTFWVVEQVVG